MDNNETIRLWTFIKDSFVYVYDEYHEHTDELVFEFSPIDSGAMMRIENAGIEYYEADGKEKIAFSRTDKIRMCYLRFHFRRWNFDEPMTFSTDGGLDDESFDKLMRLPKAILERISDKVTEFEISQDERNEIVKQTFLLFGKNGGGVANPHPMISLYCLLTTLWEKFGINYFDFQRLPVREKNALRLIATQENIIRSKDLNEIKNNAKGGRR